LQVPGELKLSIWRYLGRRAIFVTPQVIALLALTFVLVRLVPGDPARLMAGPLAKEEGLKLIRERMGLDASVPVQFVNYVWDVLHGDLGYSWYTGNSVVSDILARLPATLELIVLSLAVTFFVMVPVGLKSVSFGMGLIKRVARRVVFGYGMAAGAFPDFWFALVLIFVFYAVLGLVPAPLGQLDIGVSPPVRITGMYVLDSLLTGNWAAFRSSVGHLILPVVSLAFIYGGAILKMAIVTAVEVQKSPYIGFARVCAVPTKLIQKYVTRAVMPAVATLTAVIFGFLVGGAVLIETVFSWGGFGQYSVQAVVNSDFAAIQGVVLVSALINLVVYIFVDIVYFLIDPRVRNVG